MRKVYLLLTSLFVFISLIYAIDPAPPHVSIKVVNKSNMTIDSLLISSDGIFDHQLSKYDDCIYDSTDFIKSNGVAICSNTNHNFKIKVRFMDSSIVFSRFFFDKERYAKYNAVVTKNEITIKKDYSDFINESIKVLIYIILISYFFKVIIYLRTFKVISKIKYSIKYTFINFVILSIIYFANKFVAIGYGTLLILSFALIVPYLIEYYLHKNDNNIISYRRNSIIAVNIVFYSVGLILFSVVWFFVKLLLGFRIFS